MDIGFLVLLSPPPLLAHVVWLIVWDESEERCGKLWHGQSKFVGLWVGNFGVFSL